LGRSAASRRARAGGPRASPRDTCRLGPRGIELIDVQAAIRGPMGLRTLLALVPMALAAAITSCHGNPNPTPTPPQPPPSPSPSPPLRLRPRLNIRLPKQTPSTLAKAGFALVGRAATGNELRVAAIPVLTTVEKGDMQPLWAGIQPVIRRYRGRVPLQVGIAARPDHHHRLPRLRQPAHHKRVSRRVWSLRLRRTLGRHQLAPGVLGQRRMLQLAP
jgi:hypothetical protein